MSIIKINEQSLYPCFSHSFFSIYELRNTPHSMLEFSLEKILFIFPVCNFPLICQCRIYANVYWRQAFIAEGSLWAPLIQGWENYRSACLVERDVIYLFAPGIWTEFKIFVKTKRLPFVEGCKACDQLKPSPLLFHHHLCSFPSSWYLET